MTNSTIKPDLSVRLGRLVLKNPVTVASGTFGFGSEYAEFYDVSELGAIFTKAITIDERTGNPPPRIAETPAGMLNSIGLQNPGLEQFLKEIVPEIKKINTVIIANVAGNCVEDYGRIAGPDRPPSSSPLCRRSLLQSTTIAGRVLMSDIAEAPASSAIFAIRAISVTCGVNLTITGIGVT